MPLASADEFSHRPTDEPNWQENYMFMGWDETNSVGLYLHLGHLPDRRIVDTRVIVSVGGHVASAATKQDASECLAAPGIDAWIVDPLRRWNLRCEKKGTTEREAGWLGTAAGDVVLGFDIEIEHLVPPVDWTAAWAELGVPNIMTEHYEGGGRWRGRVWIDDAEIDCSGWLVRDHSWGPRDLKNALDFAWWWPTIFEDGTYLTGVSVLRAGRWGGFVLQECGDGPALLGKDPWVRPIGLSMPSAFDGADVLLDVGGSPYSYAGRMHCPVYYDTMGSHQLDDLFCVVTGPDGKRGFGDLELNLPDRSGARAPRGTTP